MNIDSPRSVRVFVNAIGVDVPVGASVLDAVRTWSPDEADAVTRGERVITDSRGLPIGADTRVSAGSIFRLVPARKRAHSADAAEEANGSEES
jgi:hypothetical protein